MQTIEQVQTAWAALDRQAKLEAWDQFSRDLDYGQAGWNPYYLVLMPMWERGEQPVPAETFSMLDVDVEDDFDFDGEAYPMPVEAAGFDQYIPF